MNLIDSQITKNEADIASLVGNMSGVFHFKGAATKTDTELYVNGAQVVEKAVGDCGSVNISAHGTGIRRATDSADKIA